jgi:hypothetical protein
MDEVNVMCSFGIAATPQWLGCACSCREVEERVARVSKPVCLGELGLKLADGMNLELRHDQRARKRGPSPPEDSITAQWRRRDWWCARWLVFPQNDSGGAPELALLDVNAAFRTVATAGLAGAGSHGNGRKEERRAAR